MEDESLLCIAHEISRLEVVWVMDPFRPGRIEHLKPLFHQKQSILDHKEDTLHQKSRAIWLRPGDENSKYLHSYSNRRRLSNSISEF